jgi:ABC-type thiamine transport system substrate-binding protein
MFGRLVKVIRLVALTNLLIAPGISSAQITPELIEAAKKEGEVMFYGAITINSSKAVGDAFEKKYGIKLRHWRGDATELINRSLAEARAGKPGFDVTLGNEVVMNTLDEKNLFAVFDPPAAKSYPKQFLDPDKKMTPWRVLPYGINYNHQTVKAEEAPKTWEELLLPKWKGQFGMANPGIHVTTLQFVLNLDKLLGPKWLKVVEGWAKQEPRVGRSLADTIQPLTAGEVKVALGYIKDKFQYPGPIEYVRMNKYLASLSFVEPPGAASQRGALVHGFLRRSRGAKDLRRLRRVCFSSGSRSQVQERREGRSDRRHEITEQRRAGELEQKVQGDVPIKNGVMEWVDY